MSVKEDLYGHRNAQSGGPGEMTGRRWQRTKGMTGDGESIQ